MDPPHFKENAVQLSNLKAGQLSQFLRYTTNCNEMDANFEWSSDTLNLRVYILKNHSRHILPCTCRVLLQRPLAIR